MDHSWVWWFSTNVWNAPLGCKWGSGRIRFYSVDYFTLYSTARSEKKKPPLWSRTKVVELLILQASFCTMLTWIRCPLHYSTVTNPIRSTVPQHPHTTVYTATSVLSSPGAAFLGSLIPGRDSVVFNWTPEVLHASMIVCDQKFFWRSSTRTKNVRKDTGWINT